jgi:hypothetical protein
MGAQFCPREGKARGKPRDWYETGLAQAPLGDRASAPKGEVSGAENFDDGTPT